MQGVRLASVLTVALLVACSTMGHALRISSQETPMRLVGDVSGSEPVRFHVLLKQHNKALLLAQALDLSTPTHADYKAKDSYTNEQIAQIVGSTAEELAMVKDFVVRELKGRVVGVHPHRDSMEVEAPAGSVERAFGTPMKQFSHASAPNRRAIRAVRSPRVPHSIARVVESIAGLTIAEYKAGFQKLDAKGPQKMGKSQAVTTEGKNAFGNILPFEPQFRVLASLDKLSVSVAPMCADGSAASNMMVPCTDRGNSLDFFEFTVQKISFDNQNIGAPTVHKVTAGGYVPNPSALPATEQLDSQIKASTCPHPTTLKACLNVPFVQRCVDLIDLRNWTALSCQCMKVYMDCNLGAGCQDYPAWATPTSQCHDYQRVMGAQCPDLKCDRFNPVLPANNETTVPQCANGQCNPVLSGVVEPNTLYNMSLAFIFQNGDRSRSASFATASITDKVLMPKDLHRWYGIPENAIPKTTTVTQAVPEFQTQYFYPPDYTTFLQQAKLPVTPVQYIGGNDPIAPGVESSLDIQWIAGMGAGINNVFYHQDDNNFILDWLLGVNAAAKNIADLWSVSYGLAEDQFTPQSGFPSGYMDRCETEFAKLTMKRVSVLIAAGDNGASNYGRSPSCVPLNPTYPSSSSWVTSVGATFITPYHKEHCRTSACPLGEAYVRDFNSSGVFWSAGSGFSSERPVQEWQRAAVGAYLEANADTLPPQTAAGIKGNVWNKGGRGYPDVAAVGHNVRVLHDLNAMPVDGTSAAAPIFAGMISLINAQRVAAGKHPMGFLNPFLYSCGDACFNDITVGNSRGADSGSICPFGFQAAAGWDPTTGLGSPAFVSMLAKAMDN